MILIHRIFLPAGILLLLLGAFSDDASAQKRWFSKIYGGNSYDEPAGIVQLQDSSYLIVANTQSPAGAETDLLVLHLDPAGNFLSQKLFGSGKIDRATALKSTWNPGKFIGAGFANTPGGFDYNAILFMLDGLGDTLWLKENGGADWDMFHSVRTCIDSTFIFAGTTHSFGSGDADVYLVKTDSTGNEMWRATFGDSLSQEGFDVSLSPDSGFVVCGISDSAGIAQGLVVKFDSAGNYVWHRREQLNLSSRFNSVEVLPDGRLFAAGSTTDSQGKQMMFVLLQPNGDLIATYIAGGSMDEEFMVIKDWGYNRIFTAGSTSSFGQGNSDLAVYAMDHGGNLSWPFSSATAGFAEDEFLTDAIIAMDNTPVLLGYTSSFPGLENIYVIKLDTLYFGTVAAENYVSTDIESERLKFNVFPNPFRDRFTIESPVGIKQVALYNVLGQPCEIKCEIGGSITQIQVNGSALPAGIYFLQIFENNNTGPMTRTLIKH